MKTMDLEGEWTLRRLSDGSERPLQLPGDIISGLFAAGEIPDPYYDRTELDLQWIGQEDWVIFREFEIDPAFFTLEHIFLNIAVIDTIADIRVNGALIGSSMDSFMPFSADIKAELKAGRNRISVLIKSPEKAAAAAAAALPYPVPASVYPVSSPHRNLIRKEQCMAGWDWGPCLMTGGIYDGISLCAFDGPRLSSVSFSSRRLERAGVPAPLLPCGERRRVSRDPLPPHGAKGGTTSPGDDFAVLVMLELQNDVPCACTVYIEIRDDAVTLARVSRSLSLKAGTSTHRFSIRVDSPRLWWPRGEGDQKLYTLAASIIPDRGPLDRDASASAAEAGAAVVEAARSGAAVRALRAEGSGAAAVRSTGMSCEKKLGFRELRLIAEEDKIGRTMKFSVNGREIFAKGANWIPADALPARRTEQHIRALLESAVEVHMNCLRVWGGGRYESDSFYELCDELGMLIWQDCMFSCALYPSDPAFLALVEAETRAQVKRLRSHACLALWCGGNEALGAITWYDESRKNPSRYIIDYDRLTEGTLGRVIRELDPDRTFWPSSPSAGPGDFSDNWHTDGRGDMHFWSVWHEGRPFSDYLGIRPRFCSEFGFQSFPGYATVSDFAPEGMRNISSPSMEDHQRNADGNSIIIRTMLRYFRMPSGFRQTLYLSQVQQALAIKTAVEYWRSLMPVCMGALYWQLNDVWPVSSWSSIEYSGTWKLLHYEAKRFYDPLLLALILKDGKISVWLVNDRHQALSAKIAVNMTDFNGSPRLLASPEARVGPRSSLCVWETETAGLPLPPEKAFIEAELEALPVHDNTAAGEAHAADIQRRRTTAFLTEPKRCSLADPRLTHSLKDSPEGPILSVSASAPAFFVSPFIDDPGTASRGRFEDSGFYLAKGETRKLRFIPACRIPGAAGSLPSAAELEKALSLFELYSSSEN